VNPPRFGYDYPRFGRIFALFQGDTAAFQGAASACRRVQRDDESMARLIPRSSRGLAVAGGLLGAAAVLLLSGCSGTTTYGTGVNPGTQTIKDIAGIAMIGGNKKPPIDYQPRAKIVAPPAAADAALPPPPSGNGTQTAAAGADGGAANPPNWPNDPDIAAAKFKADVAAREARGEPAPALKLPAGSLPPPAPPPTTKLSRGGLIDNTQLSAEQSQQMRKAFADAKSTMSLDASGKPVRRYLTDPPVEYRQPDPTQPTEFTEKKKTFHWWWQKKDDQDDSNLTPSASAGTSQQTAAAPAVAN
jgi:hypothetical protein